MAETPTQYSLSKLAHSHIQRSVFTHRVLIPIPAGY